MSKHPETRREELNLLWVFLLYIALLIFMVATSGCQNTSDALLQLPEGYWVATDQLLYAMWLDTKAFFEWLIFLFPLI